jgi:hypothetical protein
LSSNSAELSFLSLSNNTNKHSTSEKIKAHEVEKVPSNETYVPDQKETGVEGDYSGAVAKTDKAEFALVRKLDMRIMPTLWAMYFL